MLIGSGEGCVSLAFFLLQATFTAGITTSIWYMIQRTNLQIIRIQASLDIWHLLSSTRDTHPTPNLYHWFVSSQYRYGCSLDYSCNIFWRTNFERNRLHF